MERQCRICLDTENPETMISPCMCRGTAAYIHEACFQQYLDHYPDRVCRVCHYRVPGDQSLTVDSVIFLMMAVWMAALLMMSSVAEHFKVMYLFMMAGLMFFVNLADAFRGIFGISLLCVSFFFTFLNPVTAVQCILFFGLIGIIGVMFLYIPPEVMLMFVAILLMGAYSILIVSFFAMNQDIFLTAFIVPFMGLVWACVIHARPPLRR